MNEHAIELIEGKQLPYGPIYALNPVELEILKTYIETHLKTGFIQPSKTPTRAPILFDKKLDGSLRLCVNYRGFNNLTIKNRYLLPLIGESLDRLGRAKRFTQLDLSSAYHWMRIREGDEWKTAFLTRYGHFKYLVIPFGLSNAPASFQGYINKILAEKLDIFVVVYLDDILIYTEDPGQLYIEAVRWVLKQLRKYGLYANLKKCQFHEDGVRFLGFVVLTQGIRMKEEKIKAVRDWPEPQSVRDIQVFWGFANFYRRFIRNFSRIAAPLTLMLRTTNKSTSNETQSTRATENEENQDAAAGVGGAGSGGSIKNLSTVIKLAKSKKPNFAKVNSGTDFLTSGAKEAFIYLWKVFTEALILRHFDQECHIRIETDALGYAIGGVLSQITLDQNSSSHVTHKDRISSKSDIGQWHPVAFFSRKMIPAKTWYKTHDQELLAIGEAFKTWCHYLEGYKYEVLVLTDHNNLRQFMDTKSLSSRQVRWAQKLA